MRHEFQFGLRFSSLVSLLSVALAMTLPFGLGAVQPSNEKLFFETDIRPILKESCFHCHGESGEKEGGLDLRLVRLAIQGGHSGSAIVPGQPENSLLWEMIETNEMPEGSKKLKDPQKSKIRIWLEQGAATLRREPDDPDSLQFTEEERAHWAFQPVQRPVVPIVNDPRVQTPIDSFILASLREAKLDFSPKAPAHTLLRRLAYGLNGLPPSLEQAQKLSPQFSVSDWEREVERRLSSPRFGIRWARHWLDVAGYAESDGGNSSDTARPAAWRYRDYVVDAFNQNKPIDQLLLEQLAGDELLDQNQDIASSDERAIEKLTATSFLRMAPDATQTDNSLAARNQTAADAIQLVSTSVMGLTIGCAQCHDHKYDPISAQDYYNFRAIFDPAFPLNNWQQPNQRLLDLTPRETEDAIEKVEQTALALETEIKARREKLAGEILESKLADVPDDLRDQVKEANALPGGKRTPEQQALLEQYPMVQQVNHIIALLVEYDMPAYRAFEKEFAKVAEIRATKPNRFYVMATQERPDVLPESQVFFRGNPTSPKGPASPSELAILNSHLEAPRVPDNSPSLATSGRRLAYGQHLTNGQHPLTARVFVNRLWQHHFGHGLVRTPNDFGLNGERPTHPELLDWLASELVRTQWDQRHIHRLILNSYTYQQSSRRTARLEQVDPENRLLGRFNIRRIEAEILRDAILMASDQLDEKMGGQSIPVTLNSEGKAVLGKQRFRDGLLEGVDSASKGIYRRSLYLEQKRSVPLDMLAAFDQPVMNPNCDIRRHSTVATQSLWFLNDEVSMTFSQMLAKRLHGLALSKEKELITNLFLRFYTRPPTDSEVSLISEYLKVQKEQLKATQDPGLMAVASLIQAMFGSNEFLYLD